MSQPLEQIREIRSMMERSSRFLSLSGLAGILAGICGLAGALHIYFTVGTDAVSYFKPGTEILLLVDGSIVLVFALLFAVFFSVRKAKKLGYTIGGPATKQLLKSLAIPLITGGILCLGLISQELYWLCFPLSLVFYGLALVSSSRYTVNETYSLGVIEILLGLTAFFIPSLNLILWAIGFGVLHIIYGWVMYVRYERAPLNK